MLRRLAGKGAVLGFGASVGVHAVRYSGADFVYQYYTQDKINPGRAAKFMNFGVLIGGVYFFIYGPLYSQLMEKFNSPVALVLLDYNVTSNLVYFPLYYLTEEWVEAAAFSAPRALAKCHQNRFEDWLALWKFSPLGWFNYSFVPTAHRGTFSGCCGFLWALYLTHIRGETTGSDSGDTKS